MKGASMLEISVEKRRSLSRATVPWGAILRFLWKHRRAIARMVFWFTALWSKRDDG